MIAFNNIAIEVEDTKPMSLKKRHQSTYPNPPTLNFVPSVPQLEKDLRLMFKKNRKSRKKLHQKVVEELELL